MACSYFGLGLCRCRSFASLGVIIAASLLGACTLPGAAAEGGANTNDRSDGGNDGTTLLTGSMVLTPPTAAVAYGLMQRNTVSVFVDFQRQTALELNYMVESWVFSPNGEVGYGVVNNELVAFDLPGLVGRWRAPATTGSLTFLRVSDDGRSLIFADGEQGGVLDTTTGDQRASFAVGNPEDVAFLSDGEHALVVGQTTWTDHLPSTPVVLVDLFTGEALEEAVPNCTAPLVVLPAGDRALLSPTFCEEGVASSADNTWTNPDPVSIIDLDAEGPHFLKNLPGFGPVALSADGARAVAYLDMERLDAAMFDDPTQIPDAAGPRYHVMVIEPETLAFTLSPIGDALPRFAMTRDGKSLLVDASVQMQRTEVMASGELSFKNNKLSASLELEVKVFSLKAPFGSFDLEQLTYTPFGGPAASLDRFVLPINEQDVFTLKRTADGLGGALFRIDLQTGATEDLALSLRDIGLLPDAETMVLRLRAAPLQVEGGVRLQEDYCLSRDGISCISTISFTSKLVFESQYCSDPANYHDC
jgi:hypothetical protein